MFSHKRCCHGLFLKQKAYGDSLHQYLPQAVRGNTFTNCLTTQEAFCWTLGVPARANASPAWRLQLALKKESAVAGEGAVNGIQQGRVVIFTHRRGIQPSPCHLPLWLSVGCAEWAQRPLRSAAGGHRHCYTYSSHTGARVATRGGRMQPGYHVGVWQCGLLHGGLHGKRPLPSDWERWLADASEAWLLRFCNVASPLVPLS